MAATRLPLLLALTSVVGCDVQRIDQASNQALPAEVGDALDASCNRGAGTGCHSDSAGGVNFDRAGAFMSMPMMVVPGDTEGSLLGQVILDGSMPVGGFAADRAPDRYVILGWIAANAPLEDAGTGGSSSTGGGSSSDTGDSADASSGSAGETGPIEYDAFLPVLEIFTASCGGVGCHRDGGVSPPVLDDDVAYENIVGVPSLYAADMAPYVDPGNSAGSHIIRRMAASDGFTIMPPAPAAEVSAADQQTIADWIDAGAEP